MFYSFTSSLTAKEQARLGCLFDFQIDYLKYLIKTNFSQEKLNECRTTKYFYVMGILNRLSCHTYEEAVRLAYMGGLIKDEDFGKRPDVSRAKREIIFKKARKSMAKMLTAKRKVIKNLVQMPDALKEYYGLAYIYINSLEERKLKKITRRILRNKEVQSYLLNLKGIFEGLTNDPDKYLLGFIEDNFRQYEDKNILCALRQFGWREPLIVKLYSAWNYISQKAPFYFTGEFNSLECLLFLASWGEL